MGVEFWISLRRMNRFMDGLWKLGQGVDRLPDAQGWRKESQATRSRRGIACTKGGAIKCPSGETSLKPIEEPHVRVISEHYSATWHPSLPTRGTTHF